MNLEIGTNDLKKLVQKQLDNIFFFDKADAQVLEVSVDEALRRCEYCFSQTRVRSKYYNRDGEIYFNPFHSGQYAIFLYYLSNSIYNYKSASNGLADRIYYLNKVLNGLDLFYEVKMPRAFFLDHPVGSVMGRAEYGENFSFAQGCTVGNNQGVYPVIGRNVRMMSGSKIVGKCIIGDDVIISANSYVKDSEIPSSSLVFGSSPNLVIKKMEKSYFS